MALPILSLESGPAATSPALATVMEWDPDAVIQTDLQQVAGSA